MTPRSLLAPGRLAGQPVLRTQSDERLVDLVRAGSEPAFEAIVARYRRSLLRYCSRILPEERAEDVVQQTFVRAYDSMLSNTRELALRPWLYRIAHNTALNALRDRGLRHEELRDDVDGVEQPDQALERAQGLRAVLGAVQDLPERQRDAIVLREIEGRTYEEIATELGVTGGAVRQLLNRARHSVRAAATAITPVGLVERMPEWGAAGGAAGGGALAAKAAATVLVTGAVVGGVAVAPSHDEPAADAAPAIAAKARDASPAPAVTSSGVLPRALPATTRMGSFGSGSDHRRSRHGHGSGDDSSGHGGGAHSGKGSGGDDSSGHGPGGGEESEHHGSQHGSGGGGSGSGDDGGSSGSGDSGSGSSGPGSGGSGGGGSDDMMEAGAPTVTLPSGTDGSGSGEGSGGSGSGKGGGSDDDSLTKTDSD